jgi:hypothetical protein
MQNNAISSWFFVHLQQQKNHYYEEMDNPLDGSPLLRF